MAAHALAATLQNQGRGDTTLAAGGNLTLGTLASTSANSVAWNATNRRSDASSADVGSTVQAQGALSLQAGGDLSASAANVQAQGDLLASAGGDILLTAGQSAVQLDEAHQHKSKGFLSKTITTTRDTLEQTTAQATLLGGRTVLLQAGQDIAVQGSSVIGDQGVTLLGGRDVSLSTQETQFESHQFSQTRKSGLMSSGLSLTLGKQSLGTGQSTVSTGAALATVGAIAGSRKFIERARQMVIFLGGCVDADVAYHLIRGMKTLDVRMWRHCENAQAVAEFLARHPKVKRVNYPGLKSHPDHKLAGKQMRGFGGMLSFDLRGGEPAARRFANRIQLFLLAVSLGGVESLCALPIYTSHYNMSLAELRSHGVEPGTVRLSIGIEDKDDLIADLKQALR